MHGKLFYGCATALVTPFRGGKVDFDALQALIDWQIEEGVDALVLLGTTGEPACVSEPDTVRASAPPSSGEADAGR